MLFLGPSRAMQALIHICTMFLGHTGEAYSSNRFVWGAVRSLNYILSKELGSSSSSMFMSSISS